MIGNYGHVSRLPYRHTRIFFFLKGTTFKLLQVQKRWNSSEERRFNFISSRSNSFEFSQIVWLILVSVQSLLDVASPRRKFRQMQSPNMAGVHVNDYADHEYDDW